ncbi:hypothetical protein M153_3720000173 [Pseudoloma neurophilia]|uniref:Reverse transcriptase/retrotransposon-derived protein RNase H-like domain-containing protein n=1 Tax=Pseudoloma neurophilia TaxID=146866 RepID=A0A0R0LZZ3_9MICR|nr:hypothetical protein M153_3720000173 [Pseudoloma neurophilia]
MIKKLKIKEMENMNLSNYDKPFILKTDASNTGLGAVLFQEGENGKENPIEWDSKKHTPKESN